MIRVLFRGYPVTIEGSRVDFTNTPFVGGEEAIREEVEAYIQVNPGYWPDLSEVTLQILQESGAVEIVERIPPATPTDPNTIY